MHSVVDLGATWYESFETKRNGARVDADATPTVTDVQVNGAHSAALTAAAVIAQAQDVTPANITGLYNLSLDLSSLADGDMVEVSISATINTKVREDLLKAVVRDSAHPDSCFIDT